MFVQTDRVPISDEAGNTIYIRPKMDYGTRSQVLGAAADARLDDKGNAKTATVNVGRYQNALLVNNILDWDGPAFTDMACTPVNILRLDPDEPLVVKVLEEIATRNPQRQAPNPKSRTTSGSPAIGGSDSIPSAPTSPAIDASLPS